MKSNDLPPLPAELEEEIHALRREKPPEELCDQVFQSLPERAGRAKLDPKKPRARRSIGHIALFNVAPVLAMTAALGFMLFGRESSAPDHDFEISSERAVALPKEGHTWTELDLQTHHHADEPAIVQVEVPTHVRVRFPNGNGESTERHCQQERCVHRFTHDASGGVPLRVAVAHPGRYEIHVRHESNKASLRERFVLLAER